MIGGVEANRSLGRTVGSRQINVRPPSSRIVIEAQVMIATSGGRGYQPMPCSLVNKFRPAVEPASASNSVSAAVIATASNTIAAVINF